jgi:hypothetical protein
MLYRVHIAWAGFELATLVVIGTDCKGSCKSNYNTITTITVPLNYKEENIKFFNSLYLENLLRTAYAFHKRLRGLLSVSCAKPGYIVSHKRM